MNDTEHFRKLERFFQTARINKFFQPALTVADRSAEISLAVGSKFFHAGHAAHGAVCFKLLDDACYFACQSIESGHFLVTSSFNIQYFAPVTGGTLTARAAVVSTSRSVSYARGDVFDDRQRLVASGSGTFMKSRLPLDEQVGYC